MNTIVIVLLFAILGLLVYKFWKPMIPKPKREVPKDRAKLYFFYTEWCGFSQKAMPEWKKLADNTTYGNTNVELVQVNCEEDKSTCTLYEVNAYPTIKLETSTGLYDYTGPARHDNLVAFLRSTLGLEKTGSL